jgi:hypothetical protein
MIYGNINNTHTWLYTSDKKKTLLENTIWPKVKTGFKNSERHMPIELSISNIPKTKH